MKWIKRVFGKFWNAFRPGLEGFLAENLEDAIRILNRSWNELGQPKNLKDFKDQVFGEFTNHFNQSRGTWVSILIDLAWDALKNELTKSNPQFNFYK